MACIADFGECMLQDLIKFLHHSIILQMIGGAPLMLNLELLHHCVDNAINEMTPLIAHQYFWKTKPSDDIVE